MTVHPGGIANTPVPQMFGARGDDIHNDLDAINRCGQLIHEQGLGVLYLPDGHYRLGNPGGGYDGIAIHDGMTIRGQSRDGTILQSIDGSGLHLMLPVAGATNYQIESLTVDGNRATHTAGTHGIRLHSENRDVRIHNVRSRNNGGYGIGVAYNASNPLTNLNMHVSDCIIEDNGHDGFDCKISERAFLDRIVARNNGGAGIDVRGHYVVTSDCLAHGNGTWGIATGRPTSDQSGIAHHQSVNCIAHDNGNVGFRFRDQAQNTAEIIEFRVTNPMSYRNNYAGMAVICGRGTVTITSGAIYENGNHGISILDVAGGGYPDPENLYVEVISTTIRDNAGHGIYGGPGFPARLSVIGGRISVASGWQRIKGDFREVAMVSVA